MSFSRFLSKAIFPRFERELGSTMQKEIMGAQHMVDNMLAPQAFAYAHAGRTQGGAFARGMKVQAPLSDHVVKVDIPLTKKGLFQDKASWHHA